MQIGLKRDEANKKLYDEVESTFNKWARDTNFVESESILKICSLYILSFDGLSICLCFCLLTLGHILSFTMGSATDITSAAIEVLIIFPFVIVNAFFHKHSSRVERIRAVSRLKETLNAFKHTKQRTTTNKTVSGLLSSDSIAVLRDGRWCELPPILIVEGDVVKLRYKEKAPCQLELIELVCLNGEKSTIEPIRTNLWIKEGEEISKLELPFTKEIMKHPGLSYGVFVAVESAACRLIKRYLMSKGDSGGAKSRTATPFFGVLTFIANRIFKVWIIMIISSILLVFFWLSLFLIIKPSNIVTPGVPIPTHVFKVILLSPLRLTLLFTPLFYKFLLEMTDAWGNARLQSLFQWHTQENQEGDRPQYNAEKSSLLDVFGSPGSRSSVSSSTSTSSSNMSDRSGSFSKFSASRVPIMRQFRELKDILLHGLDSASNLLHTLNSTTYVCFVDKECFLVEPTRSLQEMCVFPPTETPEELFSKRSMSMSDPPASPSSRGSPSHPVVVDLVPVKKAQEHMEFEQEWIKEPFKKVLAPMSVCLAVTHAPTLSVVNAPRLPWAHSLTPADVITSYRSQVFPECLCGLSLMYGISDSKVKAYYPARTCLFLSKEKQKVSELASSPRDQNTETSTLLSLHLVDHLTWDAKRQIGGHGLQLITRGPPSIVVDYCTKYFNGETLLHLGNSEKQKLRNITSQWHADGLDVVSFGCRSVPLEYTTKLLHGLDTQSVICQLEPGAGWKFVHCYGGPSSQMRDPGVRILNYSASHQSNNGRINSSSSLPPENFKEVIEKKAQNRDGREKSLLDVNYNNLLVRGPCLEFSKNFSTKLESDRVDSILQETATKQIFLGMIALKYTAPPEVSSQIGDLHGAGIRFVYFSREEGQKTRTIGSHLGLETSWNCVISLAPEAQPAPQNRDGRVVLPSGVDNVAMHIEEVDNVPLLVSLFSNGDSNSIAKMIEIYQNKEEVVTVVGSSLRSSNFDLFDQGNCSISFLPRIQPTCTSCKGTLAKGLLEEHNAFKNYPAEILFAAALVSLPCALQSPSISDTSAPRHLPEEPTPERVFEIILQLTREARKIVDSISESLIFLSGGCCCLASLQFLHIVFVYPYQRGSDFAYLSLIHLPILSISLLSNPARTTVMKEFPTKPTQDLQWTKETAYRSFALYGVRFLPTAFLVVLLGPGLAFGQFVEVAQYVVGLGATFPGDISFELDNVRNSCLSSLSYVSFFNGHWLACDSALNAVGDLLGVNVSFPTSYAQTMTFLFVSSSFIVISWSFVDRYKFWIEVPPWKNRRLVAASGALCLLNFTFGFFTLWLPTRSIVVPPWWFWVILLVWIICIVIVDALTKRKDSEYHEKNQRYLALLFETRLGMWSPR
eukprot:GHVP01019791.1.p1 GENE.GHVP01019791.1~~GHVP01019791.1.p1  ORF type:complete len:1363 (+),score=198.85 GHVP01019791.1:41-4129(+)